MEVKWTPIANEFPDTPDKEYLIYIEYECNSRICIGLWDAILKRFIHPLDFRTFTFVTHWTDLPDPPTKK
jgi:hypothetical protein